MSAIAMKPFMGLIIRFPFGHRHLGGIQTPSDIPTLTINGDPFPLPNWAGSQAFCLPVYQMTLLHVLNFWDLFHVFHFFHCQISSPIPKSHLFSPQKQKAWDMPSSSKSSMIFFHDFPMIFPYFPRFFPWFLSHLSPSPGWGLVLWSLGSFLQRGRGLPAGPLGLLGLSEGLSYLAVPWRGWKPWWSWHTTCIVPSGKLT